MSGWWGVCGGGRGVERGNSVLREASSGGGSTPNGHYASVGLGAFPKKYL